MRGRSQRRDSKGEFDIFRTGTIIWRGFKREGLNFGIRFQRLELEGGNLEVEDFDGDEREQQWRFELRSWHNLDSHTKNEIFTYRILPN